jgi:hypothetical protein
MLRVLKNESGFGIIGTMIIMVAMLALATSVATIAITSGHLGLASYQLSDALQIAEAGADKAVYSLNKDSSFTGETATLGQGSFTTSVTSIDSVTKDVVSTGSVKIGRQHRATTVWHSTTLCRSGTAV